MCIYIYSVNGENSVPGVFSPRLRRNLKDAEDEEDDVFTDFRSTTTRKPDAIFEH